jgi:leucyl/phenylalanyl-tRNA--protein transferase
VHLAARLRAGRYRLLDTQFVTPHLASLGAVAVPRAAYRAMLEEAVEAQADFFAWPADMRIPGSEILASFALQRDSAP